MKVICSNGIDDSRQHIVIVIAGDGICVDSRSGQLGEPGFQWSRSLEKTVVMVDNVPTQGYEIDLFLDRSLDNRMPYARTGKSSRIFRVRYLCGAPTDMNVSGREYLNGHCPDNPIQRES